MTRVIKFIKAFIVGLLMIVLGGLFFNLFASEPLPVIEILTHQSVLMTALICGLILACVAAVDDIGN